MTRLLPALLFLLSGVAIISDEAWPDIDTTAIVGATIGVIGIAFVTVLVLRQLREGSQPPVTEPTPAPGGTSTRATPSFSHRRPACRGAAPPKAIMVYSLRSSPFSTA